MKKTDLEIAVDAVRYCRSELARYERLLKSAKEGSFQKKPSEEVCSTWKYEAERLKHILGEREDSPVPPWYKKKGDNNGNTRL